jgi:hypothetical protein
MWCSACEIRGRLRCSAASVGYRGRIWEAFIHSLVTPLSRNLCQARNYHRRGIPAAQGRGRELRACAPVPRSANWIHLCAECAFVAFAWSLRPAAGMDRRRRESRLIRPPTDTGHAPFTRRRRRQVFPRATRPGRGASFRVFQKNVRGSFSSCGHRNGLRYVLSAPRGAAVGFLVASTP